MYITNTLNHLSLSVVCRMTRCIIFDSLKSTLSLAIAYYLHVR